MKETAGKNISCNCVIILKHTTFKLKVIVNLLSTKFGTVKKCRNLFNAVEILRNLF